MVKINKMSLEIGDVLEKIIPFYETDFGNMINARELHEALGVKKKYTDWIKYYTKTYSGYNFGTSSDLPEIVEEYDYFLYEIPAAQKKGKKIEYMISIDMGKELAMMSRCEMGSEIRKYFINAEKALRKMTNTLVDSDLSAEQKIAEALILSQQILNKTTLDIKKANRNRDYNKKVNVKLRREIKSLKREINELLENKENNNGTTVDNSDIIEEMNYMEDNLERLEEENLRLKTRLNNIISFKITGKALLDSLANADITRRQKFAFNEEGKKKAKIKAYVFRKDSILKSGIVIGENSKKKFIDNIHVNDIHIALNKYVEELKKLVSEEAFEEYFEAIADRVAEYSRSVSMEKENNTETSDEKEEVLF